MFSQDEKIWTEEDLREISRNSPSSASPAVGSFASVHIGSGPLSIYRHFLRRVLSKSLFSVEAPSRPGLMGNLLRSRSRVGDERQPSNANPAQTSSNAISG
jgi:hypothetical protein